MTRYIAGRIAQMLPTLFGSLLLLFLALFVVPTDPVHALMGTREPSPEFRQAITERYGLDQPLPVQFGRYVGSLARGDLGESVITRRPVRDIIGERLPVTLRLAAVGIVFIAIFGIGAGVAAALRRGSVFDVGVTVTSVALASVPVFVLGVLLQIFVALKFRDVLGLPVTGLEDGFRSYILPGFVLAAASVAYLSRVQRSSLLDTLEAEHVRAARARGLRERRVVANHAWRNSLIPVITFLGLDLGALLGGAILTETVFNINGIGRTIATAISQGDNQVVIGITVFIVLAYLVINLLVDIAYAALDPRIRYAGGD